MTITDEQAAALRKPFPKSAIGKIPKGGIQLDYVGHAAVTDRLLSVDPEWTWEPMALSPEGLPMPDGNGNLWIRLTVCGVTRIGVGDGKSMKELIGDAIRNAAMRFGVALDLWSKEELESVHDGDWKHNKVAVQPTPGYEEPQTPTPFVNDAPPADPPPTGPRATAKQVQRIAILADKLGLERDRKLAGVAATIGREIASTKDLTPEEASACIDAMQATIQARDGGDK